ncbi:MAG: alpha/beta hydrolase [Planctomycetota bacterium]|nr:MAG: alpha/beta hydrolase [Planctomycetota bacterium]
MSGPSDIEAADRRTEASAPTPGRLRRATRAVATLVVGYLVLVLIMLAMENSLIFFPSAYPEGIWHPPGLEFEDAWFEAADGTKLHGWYVHCDDPRALVLIAHGNAGNLSHRYDLLQQLHRRQIAAMIFDYRGYGRSTGSPSEAGVLADARAARQWLAQRTGVAEGDIVLLGESLGGGVMVDLAARDGAAGLILENTFTSLPDVAAYHYPWLPVRLLMRTRLDSAAKIGSYRGPLLQVHGDADTIIPYEIGQRLHEAAGEPKELVTIEGGDHNDPRTAEFYAAVDRFIDRLNAPGEDAAARE